MVGKCELTVPQILFKLFVWTKVGVKTGYLSTEEPQFSVEDDIVHFSTNQLTMDIHRDTLDKFTLERVLPEHPTSIRIPSTISLSVGLSEQLDVTLWPSETETTLTWFNDNPEVVSVTEGGLVTALKSGEANVMVQTSNGLHANCHIVVPEPRLRFYVWMRGGEVHVYDMDERPDVELGETLFTLTTKYGYTAQYPAADILRFTLQDAVIEEEIADGISVPEAKATNSLQFREGTLLFADCPPNSPVKIYNTMGLLVQTAQTDCNGSLSLSLASLRAGIYIIRTETTTIKIQKR